MFMVFPVLGGLHRLVATISVVAVLLLSPGCGQEVPGRIGSIYEWKADPTAENRAKIRERIDDEDADVRATALNAMVSLKEPDAVDLALAAMDDPDGFVRSIAAKLLGDLGNPVAIDPLVEALLGDADQVTRQRAAEALQLLGGMASVEGLALGLEDPIKEVRLASVKGLKSLDPGFATPELARLLIEDTVWEVRVQAARALGLSGRTDVVPVLESALADSNEFVRSAAANALRELEKTATDPAYGPGGPRWPGSSS